MGGLSELYQNVILEHNRSPRNYRAMPDADRSEWVRTEDVAHVVAFLLSERAAAVTGASLTV